MKQEKEEEQKKMLQKNPTKLLLALKEGWHFFLLEIIL